MGKYNKCAVYEYLANLAYLIHNWKIFRESKVIFACVGRSRKLVLNACDCQSLRPHCIKQQHDTMKDISTWAWYAPENAVSKHRLSLHLQTQVKTPPCEVKAVYQQHPEMLPASPSSSEMHRHTVETWAVVCGVHILSYFWKLMDVKRVSSISNDKGVC